MVAIVPSLIAAARRWQRIALAGHYRIGHALLVTPVRRLILSHRCAAMMLIVLALLARALVPTGWMTSAAPDGMALSICTGMGPAEHMGMHGKPQHQPPAQHPADHPCAFAALAIGLDAPSSLPPSIAPLVPQPAPAPAAASVAVGRGLAAPPPPATGPPLLS